MTAYKKRRSSPTGTTPLILCRRRSSKFRATTTSSSLSRRLSARGAQSRPLPRMKWGRHTARECVAPCGSYRSCKGVKDLGKRELEQQTHTDGRANIVGVKIAADQPANTLRVLQAAIVVEPLGRVVFDQRRHNVLRTSAL